MLKAYKYKVYSGKKQRKLHRLANTAGRVYNHCIALHKRYYRMYGKSLNHNRLKRHIARIRKTKPDWQRLNSQTVQDIVLRIKKGYAAYKHTKRFPSFKKSRKYKSFTFAQSGYKIKGNAITINSIGTTFKFHYSRPYGKIKTITFKRDSLGDFYVILVCEIERPKQFARTGKTAGFDFGLKTFLTSSDGEEIESPQFYKQYSKAIAKANKKLSKKVKGSNNWYKAKDELNRVYRKMTNKRDNHQWEIALHLVRKYDVLCFEDLNLEGMKRLWGRKVSDLSLYSLLQKVEYLASVHGRHVQKVDRFFPSSKLHWDCGHTNKITLRDRTFACQGCGEILHRDKNAAKNIHRQGIADYASGCKTSLLKQSASRA